MLYCTYLTIYQGTYLPIFYFGSTSVQKIKNGYRGSVASKEYKDIWKEEIKNNPQLFNTKILSTYLTRNDAYDAEVKIHQLLKTYKNPLYVNKSTGCPRNNGIAWNKGLKLPHLCVPNAKKGNLGKSNPMYGVTRTKIMALANAASVAVTKGNTYEEIYGEERANQLKQDRSHKLKDYIKNTPDIRSGKNNANAKIYKFIDPKGSVHIVEGALKSFCLRHKLESGAVINCVKGRRPNYKGWIISYN
jgi:hypothetical protein